MKYVRPRAIDIEKSLEAADVDEGRKYDAIIIGGGHNALVTAAYM